MSCQNSPPPRLCRAEQGFTLVEMLVVLAILAVMMAGAPSIFAGLPALKLRAAADGMADTLRGLHDSAIKRGSAQALVLDMVARSYVTTTDLVQHRLPEVVERVEFQGRSVPPGAPLQVRFFPDGSATASTILLRHGNRSEMVTVDWLTGQVRRDG